MISLPREIFNRLKKGVPFFHDFSDEELITFLKLMKSEKFPNGSIIFREFEGGDKMYIILKGEVEIIKRIRKSKDGHVKETVLATLGSGECFGEMGLIDQRARSATARSKGESFLFSMAEETIYKISNNPRYSRISSKLYRNFSIMLAQRLRESNERYAEIKSEVDGE